MAKVRRQGRQPGKFQQLPLFNEIVDPALSDDLPGRITPEQAHAILKEHGMDVNLEQAKEILTFLRRFAMITLAERPKK